MKETKPHEGERRDVISQLENQIATYSDVLYEKMDEISYAEYLSPKKDMPNYGTEWEDYVDIKKSDMKKSRNEGHVPGIYYSHDSKDSIPFYITKTTLRNAYKHL